MGSKDAAKTDPTVYFN